MLQDNRLFIHEIDDPRVLHLWRTEWLIKFDIPAIMISQESVEMRPNFID